MVTLGSVLIAGGLVYTGSLVYEHLRTYGRQLTRARRSHIHRITDLSANDVDQTKQLACANQTVTVSSLALGMTVAGFVLKPVLMVVSVPAALIIFAPTLQEAWHSLRHDRRITPSVLDTTRLTLCILMGFYISLALDTWLRTIAQRMFLRSEVELQALLDRYFRETPTAVWCFRSGAEVQAALDELEIGDILSIASGELIPADGTILHGVAWIDEQLVTGHAKVVHKATGDSVFASTLVERGQIYVQITALVEQIATQDLRERLEQMTMAESYLIRAGTRSGQAMAPKMLGVFTVLLPFWEANRAAGFLTTSFGSQMARLGPYALQNFAIVALKQNILIYDGRGLEALNLVNTVVINANLLADETLYAQTLDTLAALRCRRLPIQEVTPHRFAIYLLADRDEAATKTLAATLGFDDYFVEPSVIGRAELLERLRIGGRTVCYVGSGDEDTSITNKALVTVAIPSAHTAAARQSATQDTVARLKSTTAHIVLLEKDLRRLDLLFALATQFGMSEGLSLAWPLLMDIVDITTTVFIHFGLTYSILFNYSGLLGGALYTRLPLIRYLRQQQQQESVKPVAPDRQIPAVPQSRQ
ncbi:MAG: hypothetical protein R2867_31640 [Caldilineaceae bacterium]